MSDREAAPSPWILDSMTPAGPNAPLGESRAADFDSAADVAGIITSRGEGHRLIVGPTGSGKFWAAIAPMLLTADHASVIVFDVASGEAARLTRPHRAKLGKVLVLDPYQLVSDGSDGLNPLEALGVDDGGMLGRAGDLADAITLITRTGGNSDYWNGQARDLLVALLIHVWTSPLEHDRTLRRVRQIIRRPLETPPTEPGHAATGIIYDMVANLAVDNFVRDAAENVLEDELKTDGRNNFYVRQVLRENTSFLDEPEVQRVTAHTTLELRRLREGIGTLYVVAPARKLKTLGRWLRLVYSVVLPEMLLPIDEQRHSAGGGIPLHIVMDEFAAFGPFLRVTDDMATVRKFGIGIHLAVQKLSQLRSLYKDAWETFVPKYLQVLGCDEQTTAEYISKRLGTTPRPRPGESESRSMSGPSRGTSISYQTESLMVPHEVSQLDAGRCVVVVQGSDNLDLRKWNAYDSDYLIERSGTIQRRWPSGI